MSRWSQSQREHTKYERTQIYLKNHYNSIMDGHELYALSQRVNMSPDRLRGYISSLGYELPINSRGLKIWKKLIS